MNKLFLLIGFLFLGYVSSNAQLSTGDIAFVGFNADGVDDIAFVNFKSIPANTTIYFCDSEWDGTQFGTDENDFVWNSGSNDIAAGTVIVINNLDAAIAANIGSVTGGTGLSKSGDAVFAYLGTAMRAPTTFLAAISNIGNGFGNLSGTGLQSGLTAIILTETADIAIYDGPRTGLDKNGYLAQLNDMSKWLIQDTDNDNDHADGVAPDLPFNTTPFDISTNDVTPPSVTGVTVITQNTIKLQFSEGVNQTTAAVISNYGISPSVNITDAAYDDATHTVTLTHDGLSTGTAYTLSVSNIDDIAGNVMSPFTSGIFYYNQAKPELIITEIMYNAPSDSSDNLEFLEIYNAGANDASLGGLKVKDEANFVFTFPEMTLPAGGTVLLATDKEAAEAFYGQTFLDMAAGAANMLGNGGELLQILTSNDEVISEVEYDDAAPWPTSADGSGPSLELLNTDKDANAGTSWAPATNLVGQSMGLNVYASPGSYVPVNTPTVSFTKQHVTVSENGGSAELSLALSNAFDKEVTVQVSLTTGIGTAVEGTDFIFGTQTYTFPANSTSPIAISIPVINNQTAGNDRFLVLNIHNPVNTDIGSIGQAVVFILDDEKSAPVASKALDIEYAGSYHVDDNGTAEIVAFDSSSQRLFVLNSTATKVEILDFKNPRNMTKIASIDMLAFGSGATSVAVKNGLVAATVTGVNFADGKVVFMDIDGNILSSVTVGNLPDMITFTPDGKSVLTANEGQPNDDYSIDPEGSVSVIDISKGAAGLTQADVSTINFNAYDAQADQLKAAGIRIFGLTSSVSQDFEPEYISISENSEKAWVTLQENNAIAVLDLKNKTVTDIFPLGLKDYSLAKNSLDVSDKIDSIFMGTWNLKGMYMPDAIASYTIGNTTYLVTANEGDQREYGPINEDVKVSDASYVLDPVAFPNGNLLKKDFLLGRLAVTPYSGDLDGDGDFDEIHTFGARSFSIWNAATGALVYDSGNDFEKITAADPVFGKLFNASNDNNTFKNRSDNKGPEPEGVTIAPIKGSYYAITTLERTGGIMTYDVTNPAAPVFVNYTNSRALGSDEGGDLGPEGIIYVSPDASPADTALIVVANEISATISVYYIKNVVKETVSIKDLPADNTLITYPNPASSGKIYFNESVNVTVYSLSGIAVKRSVNTNSIDISGLTSGSYVIKTDTGKSTILVIP